MPSPRRSDSQVVRGLDRIVARSRRSAPCSHPATGAGERSRVPHVPRSGRPAGGPCAQSRAIAAPAAVRIPDRPWRCTASCAWPARACSRTPAAYSGKASVIPPIPVTMTRSARAIIEWNRSSSSSDGRIATQAQHDPLDPEPERREGDAQPLLRSPRQAPADTPEGPPSFVLEPHRPSPGRHRRRSGARRMSLRDHPSTRRSGRRANDPATRPTATCSIAMSPTLFVTIVARLDDDVHEATGKSAWETVKQPNVRQFTDAVANFMRARAAGAECRR